MSIKLKYFFEIWLLLIIRNVFCIFRLSYNFAYLVNGNGNNILSEGCHQEEQIVICALTLSFPRPNTFYILTLIILHQNLGLFVVQNYFDSWASSGRTLKQLLNMFYQTQRLYLLLTMFSIKQMPAAKNMKYEWLIKSSLLDIFSSSSSTWNIMLFLIFRDHSFSTYAKFSTKLTFLISWYAQYQNFKRLQLSLLYLNFL